MRSCLILLLFSVSACTSLSKTDGTGHDGALSWHSCRFRIHWPADSKPDKHVDLFLAHAVIKPVLDKFRNQIPYWRFHRRFARDAAGHRFSFIFFTDNRTTDRVRVGIKSSGFLEQAMDKGIIRNISCEDIEYWSGTPVGAASDKNWSGPVQQNWPDYIMGVSALWLGMINDLSGELSIQKLPLEKMLARYRHVSDEVTDIWRREGGHAFQHHLDAIFGYEQRQSE